MKKNSLLTFFLGIIIGLSVGAIVFLPHNPFFKNPMFDKIKNLIISVNKNYIKPVSVDTLIDQFAAFLMQELDPYSYYLSKDEYREYKNDIYGYYYGFGFSYFKLKNQIYIGKVFKNSPADKKGLSFGYKILKINNISPDSIPLKRLKNYLKGKKHIKLRISNCKNDTIQCSLTADTIYLSNILYTIYADTVAYIKINSFTSGISQKFRDYLSNIKSKKINNLVIDLRNNSGGLIKEAYSILDAFFPKGILLFTIEKNNSQKNKFIATDYYTGKGLKLIVLVNKNTASAAELFAGVIQDYDRGIIIGSKTFGKAVVQNDILLENGGVLHITTKRVILPSGRWIQKNSDLYDREKDTIITYKTLHNRPVFSNTGIIPDITKSSAEISYLIYFLNDNRDTLAYYIDTLCSLYAQNPQLMVDYLYKLNSDYNIIRYWLLSFGISDADIYLLPYDDIFKSSLLYFSENKYRKILNLDKKTSI